VASLKGAGADVVDVVIDDGKVYMPYVFTVMLHELKAGMAEYLAKRGGSSKTLADLVARNDQNAKQEFALFGQELFLEAANAGGLDDPKYRVALRSLELARKEVADDFAQARIDAFFQPAAGIPHLVDVVRGDAGADSVGSAMCTLARGPVVTVPGGFVGGLPYGVSFEGLVGQDASVVQMAYAFEQATHHRRAPLLPRG
jgi:amidase